MCDVEAIRMVGSERIKNVGLSAKCGAVAFSVAVLLTWLSSPARTLMTPSKELTVRQTASIDRYVRLDARQRIPGLELSSAAPGKAMASPTSSGVPGYSPRCLPGIALSYRSNR